MLPHALAQVRLVHGCGWPLAHGGPHLLSQPACLLLLPQEAIWAFFTCVSEKTGRWGPCWPCRRCNPLPCPTGRWKGLMGQALNLCGGRGHFQEKRNYSATACPSLITHKLCLEPCMAPASAAPWSKRCCPLEVPGGARGGFPREARELGASIGISLLTGTSKGDYSVGGEE